MPRYCDLSTSIGRIHLAFTGEGLCKVGLSGEKEFLKWLGSHFREVPTYDESLSASPAAHQIEEFLKGRRRDFDLSFQLLGTDFQKRVWRALLAIPYGKTATYGEIALKIGESQASRAVGGACGANPLPLIVPCHRVLASNGSLGGFSSGLPLKKRLLELEKHSS